uniref:Uncharacterized protein n=1 Tax=Leersia perrieri TaxID=77586 RepID=A0A0D9Y1N5_9ORYZ
MAVDVVFAAVEQGGWGSSAGFRHHDGDGSQRRRHGQPLLQLSKTATTSTKGIRLFEKYAILAGRKDGFLSSCSENQHPHTSLNVALVINKH